MGLFTPDVEKPIDALGNAFDKIFTSDEERLQGEAVLEKLRQAPDELQAAINKIEAGHRSIFVAGWRPFIGWTCGAGLAFAFVISPLLAWGFNDAGPVMPMEHITELVFALLGMGALRTYEKKTKVTK